MAATPPCGGWHWKEWGAEFTGTALLLYILVTARYGTVRAGFDPLAQLAIVGTTAAVVGVAVAVSPLGARSGGHLNPALTFGLWLQRVVSTSDLGAYVVAQCAGAVLGVAAARMWGPAIAGRQVNWAVVEPRARLSPPQLALVEAAAVGGIFVIVFVLLASARYHRWAAPVSGLVLVAAVCAAGQVSGAGFNPARVLGSDVMAGALRPEHWIYWVGPMAGAAVAAAVAAGCRRRPVTGKLRHDASIRCWMRCDLPHDRLLPQDRS
ncbi:aquaporin [Catellatospora chokoriensis]|uniref:Aquaporin n=1 Tax=Catellatospora chokoriensis TaxID=310353 RepID=A0A8J3KCU4_9ACTN|nr:aquaporin [Catellatospora chokoriensis]GIF94860.1 aquaporin [Catellatospora chokoriensis]